MKGLLRTAVSTELRRYAGAVRLLTGRPDVPEGSEPVRYVGAVAALLWAFTIVSAVELVALHFIIPWHTVRIVADVLGIWGVLWCLGLTGCHYVYPHLVTTEGLRVRMARRDDVATIPWSAIGGVGTRERSVESGRAVQVDGGVLLVTVGKRTNVEVRLTAPLPVAVRGVTHEVTAVRLFADDPKRVREAWDQRSSDHADQRRA